jgi:hypothetical protein
MSTRRMHRFSVAVGSLLFAVACNESSGPDRTPPRSHLGGQLATGDFPRPLDDDFAKIAELVPGFGGIFFDGKRLSVYLLNPADQEIARIALQTVLRENRPFLVRQGSYGFQDLARWRETVRGALELPGVLLTDVDEARNRVRIGVVDEDARVRVLQWFLSTSVPPNATIVEVVPPLGFNATLQDRIRPTVGGLQIATSSFFCTLSGNGRPPGMNVKMYAITNSHCTNTQGGSEGTVFYQNTSVAGNEIGTETLDPEYITGFTCPAGRRCRRSDAALIQASVPHQGEMGFIALPVSRAHLQGSLTLATTVATEAIYIEAVWGWTQWFGGVYVGQELDKVGRTTGWTYGNVSSTCVDVNVDATDITLWCQTIVDGGVNQGDSGSPVFTNRGTVPGPIGTPDTQLAGLVGVLWGGTATHDQFAFSPFPSVLSELTADTIRWCSC